MKVALPRNFEPRFKSFFFDDFTGNNLARSWGTASAGAGAAVATDTSLVTNLHPGTVLLRMGSNSASTTSLFGNAGFILGNSRMKSECSLIIPTLSDATNRYIIRVGFGDTTNGTDFNNGVYFEYDEATSANWRIATASAASRTKTTTSVAVSTAWTHLEMRIINATSVEFFVNGVSVGTHTTNIPTAGVRSIYKGNRVAANAQRTFAVDYHYRETFFNTGR